MDRCKISEWEVVPGAPNRENILCLMHDPCSLCKTDTNVNLAGTKIDVKSLPVRRCLKTGVHNVDVKSKDKTSEANLLLGYEYLGDIPVHQQSHRSELY